MRAPAPAMGGRSLLFAVLVGLGAVPFSMVAAPVIGWESACVAIVLVSAVLYLVVASPSWSRALPVAVLAALLSLLVGLLASTITEAVLGAALVVGLCRSGVLYRRAAARCLTVELGLLLVGLLFARLLASPSPLGAGLALWGFFLVQSLFFVVGGWEPRPVAGENGDAFDEAERRVMEVLRSAGGG